MSRKRAAPIGFYSNGTLRANIQVYSNEYYRPGCYCINQVVPEVTLCNYAHWQPYCNTATYVVDRFGTANYPSDFAYQLQVPTSGHPQPIGMIYSYYDDGEVEISALPQIEEEDVMEDLEVSVRKRKRLNDKVSEEFLGNVYRANEGYLVEEPNENVPESV